MALSKNTIKFIKSLHRKKFRQKYNKFIAEGEKIVEELLKQQKYTVLELYATATWVDKYSAHLTEQHPSPVLINEGELKLISQLTTPNQVMAIVAMPPVDNTADWSTDWCLYLDGLQDPGNVGTILRIADWFAIPHVAFGPGTVDLFNSKTIQASMGAFLRVNCETISLDGLKENYHSLPIWGATMAGENVFNLDIPKSGVLVIGNEGKGIQEEHLSLLHQQVAIAAPQGGGAESLNAGVAAGILCAALRR